MSTITHGAAGMKTKFDNELVVDWYRSPVDPGVLRELNERDDVQGFKQAGGHLTLIVLTGALAVYVQLQLAWWLLVPALLLHGTVCAFMTNAEHELVHGTVFKRRWLNAFFLNVFGFLRWFPYDYYWASHTEHHKVTLHAPHDLELVLPTRFTLSEFLRTGFVDPLKLIEMLRNNVRYSTGRLEGVWENYVLVQDRERRAVTRWARTLLAGHFVIVAASIWSGYWIVAVVVSLTPCYGGWLFYLCNNTQHAGLRDEVPDFRRCCRTMSLPAFVEFLYWGMNYHTEHHMYAAVPCYRLRRLHELVRDDLPPTLGLAATWRQMIAIQRRQLSEPDYQYEAPLPPPRASTAHVTEVRSSPALVSGTTAAPAVADRQDRPDRIWECGICGYTYSQRQGLPEEGIAPGTAWEDVPDDWMCPDCGTSKSAFQMVEITAT